MKQKVIYSYKSGEYNIKVLEPQYSLIDKKLRMIKTVSLIRDLFVSLHSSDNSGSENKEK